MTASIHQLGDKRAPSLDPMIALTAADMNAVNAVILDRMQSKVSMIPSLPGHLIAGGGKRMRPMLTLASAALLDYTGTRHHKLAAAVEFIHTATLLHDDVVDGSGMRRGKRTANMIWGNPASVLVGDFLFSRAFELMVEDGSLKVLRILSHASAVIAEGEVDQLTAQRQVETTEEHYLPDHQCQDRRAVRCGLPAFHRSSPKRARRRGGAGGLWPLSRNRFPAGRRRHRLFVGRRDDGQGPGDDFRDGKVTLPVILAYARGRPRTAPGKRRCRATA